MLCYVIKAVVKKVLKVTLPARVAVVLGLEMDWIQQSIVDELIKRWRNRHHASVPACLNIRWKGRLVSDIINRLRTVNVLENYFRKISFLIEITIEYCWKIDNSLRWGGQII